MGVAVRLTRRGALLGPLALGACASPLPGLPVPASTPEARALPTPAVAGFRPGYGYRLQLTNLPEEPGRSLYPSLEVLSTLHVPPTLRAEDFPATIVFTVDDLKRAAAGGLVTKVVYLEDPMQAPAVTTTATSS